MTTTAKIEELQKSVINAINNSCLHPAVVLKPQGGNCAVLP